MTPAVAAVAIPWVAACALAALPPGRLSAHVDLTVSIATLVLTCGLPVQADVTFGVLRLDRLATLFMILIAASGAASRWIRWQRPHGDATRRASGQIATGAMLLVCLLEDPLLSWLALAIAAAAALFPALPWDWNRVPLTGGALGLALFGIVAAHAPSGLAVVAPAGVILGYTCLAGVLPELLVAVLALLLRLRGMLDVISGRSMLVGIGLGMTLACGIMLWLGPKSRRRSALFRLGHAGVATLAFGLGGLEATFAGLVQVSLLVLAHAATAMSRPKELERTVAVAALAGLPPVGVFPGVVLIVLASAHRSPWLLLPLGAGLGMLGWAAIADLSFHRWSVSHAALPAWLPLALLLLIGWLLPSGAADWLRAAASMP